jgi:hypothetical protein
VRQHVRAVARASAASITELLSTIARRSGWLPGGSSSSPVITSRTRGRRTHGHAPDADRREQTRVLRPQHAARAQGELARAHVLSRSAPTFLRGATGSLIATEPSRSSHTSAIATASAPSGTGAPVITRTRSPRDVPANGAPGSAWPSTRSAIGS